VTAYTNRRVREGKLVIVGTEAEQADERVPEHPNALRFRFPLENPGRYQVRFTSEDGEPNVEPIPSHEIKVLIDQPPVVRLTEPKEESDPVKLPPDGLLKLAGVADDDFGLTRLDL